MRLFALFVFVLHILAELTFGANAFLSGGFSAQSAEELAYQAANIEGAVRFLGAAVFILGLLGALVVFGPGGGSAMGRSIAGLFAVSRDRFDRRADYSVPERRLHGTRNCFPLGASGVGLGFFIVFARHESKRSV